MGKRRKPEWKELNNKLATRKEGRKQKGKMQESLRKEGKNKSKGRNDKEVKSQTLMRARTRYIFIWLPIKSGPC